MIESPAFLEMLILLGAVTAVATACYYLRLPTIVGFIVAGMAVGPSGLALVSSVPNAGYVAELAVVLLMFTIGLEFSGQKLIAMRWELVRLGLAQVALTTAVAAGVAMLFGMAVSKALFVGGLVSLSSTALVMKLLQDGRDMEAPYGQPSLAVLLAQDLAVIPMLLVLPVLAGAGALPPAALGMRAAGWVLGLLGALWLASRHLVPQILERVALTRSRELFFFCVVFLCLGVAYLFDLGGLPVSLGAFAAGLMLGGGPYGRQVTADVLPMRDNFLGLFFASVGMLLDLRFVSAHVGLVLFLSLALFTIKGGATTLVAMSRRLPPSIAVVMGMMLAQVGEFSFILADRGHAIGLLADTELQLFLSVSVLSMALTPFLFKLAPRLALMPPAGRWRTVAATTGAAKQVKAHVRAESRGAAGAPPGGKAAAPPHTVIVGFGITGQNLAAALAALGIPYRAIELNYDAVRRLSKEGIAVEFGDATRAEVLEHAGIGSAALVVIAVSGAKMHAPILAAVRRLRPDVQVIVRAQYVRDVEEAFLEERSDVVVAEIETAVELLARALRLYGVSTEEIRDFMTQARAKLSAYARLNDSSASAPLPLPSWEALAAIRPLRLGAGFAAAGRSLVDLALPRRTGASVVSVFRVGLGTTVPHGEFVLAAGDVLHLIGGPEALAAAEQVLRTGSG